MARRADPIVTTARTTTNASAEDRLVGIGGGDDGTDEDRQADQRAGQPDPAAGRVLGDQPPPAQRR